MIDEVFDYVIVGSGFGGSVSALRLSEKGYRVLVLERGKRFGDEDFPKTTWNLWKYLWMPALRCFGILQLSFFKHIFVLHGSGVGGGSLGYAAVLMEPDAQTFAQPGWTRFVDWPRLLRPHYDTARRILGVAQNPRVSAADQVLREIADASGRGDTLQPTDVGIFFGEPGQEVPDPFFAGEGPARRGCTHCGGCMVGCRHNAKNTLLKNYLYLAERRGVEVRAECEVRDMVPLPDGQSDGARYVVRYGRATAWLPARERRVRARSVIVAAGALGTLRLLFRCRDVTRSLPRISATLGESVRTNSENILGVTSRHGQTDYSQGVAITSLLRADAVTSIEPVRYPAGSGAMRLLAAPWVDGPHGWRALVQSVKQAARRPRDYFNVLLQPGWASRSTIILVMQNTDNRLRMRLGRGPFTLFRRGLVSEHDAALPIPTRIRLGQQVTREFAERSDGIPCGALNDVLLNIPMTAHLIGGCPFGRDAREGVVGVDGQVHNYPGLYVVDGSIIPANPGINPSLTIAALAEHVMSGIAARA